jgi:serine/threonine protein kinase
VSKLGVGAVFAGFRIEALLGRGGMGSVYRARDLALDSERALKVLEPELTADRAFRERFQREARLAAQIENPAVVPVYQAGEDDGRLFIAMRLIRGPDLHRLVAKDGPLEPQRTARIVAAVTAALDEAHARGIVHRDVKPANILVELSKEGERVFLTDFGISRSARPTEEVTSTGQLLGTADYISPEQIEGERADARSDVYALGCVVCYLLTGEPPFRRDTELATLYAHAHAARPRPSLLEPGLPAAIDEVVVRATAVDPDGRHQSAGELADDLRRALAAPSGETWATAAAETAGPT